MNKKSSIGDSTQFPLEIEGRNLDIENLTVREVEALGYLVLSPERAEAHNEAINVYRFVADNFGINFENEDSDLAVPVGGMS